MNEEDYVPIDDITKLEDMCIQISSTLRDNKVRREKIEEAEEPEEDDQIKTDGDSKDEVSMPGFLI